MTKPKTPPAPDIETEPQPEPAETPEAPAAPKVQPIGRSQTEPDRPLWEIDGKLYDVRVMDDFGIAAQRRLNRDGNEFYKLWTATEDLDDDQEARMAQLLDRMFLGDAKAPSLIDAPMPLLRKLGTGSRADVVMSFTLAPLQRLLAAAALEEAENVTDEAGVSEPTTAS